jgi:hypothetical protein
MFPETFVAEWVDRIVPRAAVVLDPFCGRGTTPFQALLMERNAIGVDVNDVAVCISRAKSDAPAYTSVVRRLRQLEEQYRGSGGVHDEWPPFFHHAFHPETLADLSFLRKTLRWRESKVDCMIAAIALGCLHGDSGGDRPYFSNQMPRTISTKPDYSIRYWIRHKLEPPKREVFTILRRIARFRYESPLPARRGKIFNADMRELPRLLSNDTRIRHVITSPPYLDVTNFKEDQWLRLWFLGGAPVPRKTRGDDRHTNSDRFWGMVADLWRTLGVVLEPRSHVVIRLGGRKLTEKQIVDGLAGTSVFSGRSVGLKEWRRSDLRRRQTGSFRPGAPGVVFEVDCYFVMR